MQKCFHLKNCFFGEGTTNVFFGLKKKSARISFVGCTRLIHYRLLDLVYFSFIFPSTTCTDNYVGETVRGLPKLAVDHTGRDTKMHIIRHWLNSDHETVNIDHFKMEFQQYL